MLHVNDPKPLERVFSGFIRQSVGPNRYVYFFSRGHTASGRESWLYTQVIGLGRRPETLVHYVSRHIRTAFFVGTHATINFVEAV